MLIVLVALVLIAPGLTSSILFGSWQKSADFQLVSGLILFILIGGISAYVLKYPGSEANRLLASGRKGEGKGEHEEAAYAAVKGLLVVGYWIFLILSILFALFFAFLLLRRFTI